MMGRQTKNRLKVKQYTPEELRQWAESVCKGFKKSTKFQMIVSPDEGLRRICKAARESQ